jgi:amino acid transporter
MQVFGLLIFVAVWLIILWIGSIALEATGMERSRARFQALSALSGTGFTTSHAEAVVDHPRRRRIVSYLIFLGNTGIIALILLVILYARAGIEPPSTATIVISVVVLLAIGLAIWFRLIDKLTTAILRLMGRERISPLHIAQKVLHQAGDYALVRLAIGKESNIIGLNIEEAVLQQQAITILAIERGDAVLFQPKTEEKLMAGDNLLCYGKLASIGAIIER